MRLLLAGCLALSAALSAQQAKDQKAPAKAEPKAPEAPKTPAPPPPKERREYNYGYDLQGRPVQGTPAAREQRQGTGAGSTVERQETLRDAEGRAVPWRDSRERVLAETETDRTTERTLQLYDLTGRPTRKQVVRTERRKSPDGSVVNAESTYEQDMNGRLQLAERRTSTEKKTASGGNTALVVERPGISGGTQVVERVDRVETRRSESVTETVSSRRFPDANGRFEERERELSLATKSGDVTSTEKRQWRVGAAGVSGQMDLISRSSSRLTENPDGSQVEDTEVYSTLIAGSTADLNRPQTPSLEQQIRRERKVQADGKSVETTSTRQRQVADPGRLGGLTVEEQVTTPTADGKTIQKTVFERDANGKMQRVASSVEEQKK